MAIYKAIGNHSTRKFKTPVASRFIYAMDIHLSDTYCQPPIASRQPPL